jgi:type IV pilus assembly protein PilE
MHNKKSRGFTLIELMITVAIVAILASIAYPSYTGYVIRSNRTAAQAQMMDIANRQQQFLLANRSYVDSAAEAWTKSGYSLPTELASRYDYSITVGTGAVPSFTITFTPKGAQTSDVTMTFNSEGVKTPIEKW